MAILTFGMIAVTVMVALGVAFLFVVSQTDWGKLLLFPLAVCASAFLLVTGLYFSRSMQVPQVTQIATRGQTLIETSSVPETSHEDSDVEFISHDSPSRTSPAEASTESHSAHSLDHVDHFHMSESLIPISPILTVVVIASVLLSLALTRKSPRHAIIVALPLAIGIFGATFLTVTHRTETIQRTETRLAPDRETTSVAVLSPEDFPLSESETGSEEIRLGDGPGDGTVTPIQIREIRFDPHTTTTSTIDQFPQWVIDAKDERISKTKPGSITLTSQRFSTIEEALKQLRPQAAALIVESFRDSHPEVQHFQVSEEPLDRLRILDRVCEITWPFQVGEFEDQVYQLVWHLNLDQSTHQKLYTIWRQDQLSHRLTILGGGLAGLTLIFGVGALVARRRENLRTT